MSDASASSSASHAPVAAVASSAPPAPVAAAASSAPPALAAAPATATAAGKRPLEDGALPIASRAKNSWLGASGDGGAYAREGNVAAAIKKSETAAVVSSLKSKLSKPKEDVLLKPKLLDRRAGLTIDERKREQERHRERAEATGKPVPHYRK